MNTSIQIKKASYPKSDFRAAGTGFTSVIQHEGYDQTMHTGLHRDGTLAEEIDNAMKRLISSMVHAEQSGAAVTITLPAGYTLSAALKQHYADKYVIEPEIASVTFA
ncbi:MULTISPECIES: hypothetical protein [Cytobacillus]|uniref:hypothetical protein n=1 Tax=Cytobacillus TaxID=2675230 RepID=UPI00204215CB|nr:hypothetical protein [Cytobacillus firmus]MCM3705839.1 hypothetical protein [Cytobacillus firmus]